MGLVLEMKDKSSGSARADGDGKGKLFFLSCKFRSTKALSLSKKDLDKDCAQARKFGLTPIWSVRNHMGNGVISLLEDDFFRWFDLLEEAKDENLPE